MADCIADMDRAMDLSPLDPMLCAMQACKAVALLAALERAVGARQHQRRVGQRHADQLAPRVQADEPPVAGQGGATDLWAMWRSRCWNTLATW